MLTAILVLAAGLAQTPPVRSQPGFDVAPGDSRVWRLHAELRAKEDAARQIASAPDSVAAFRALLELERIDEALDLLMRLVQTQPAELASALPALFEGVHFSDGTRDYKPRLRAFVAAARDRAARLPR